MGIPIIRLEVECMKQAISLALSSQAAAMDASVQAAIEAYCTPENIDAVVRVAAMQAMDKAVKEEVSNFFQWSNPGRQAVREAVVRYMDEWDKCHTTDDDNRQAITPPSQTSR